MKIYKGIFALFLSATMALSSLNPIMAKEVRQDLDYTDSLEERSTPERGFYGHMCLHMQKEGGVVVRPGDRLTHLRVDISAFSDNGYASRGVKGTSEPLSEAALQDLKNALEYIRQKNHSVIIRVCYDLYFEGKANCEPNQELILEHIKQLCPIYNEYVDIISAVELGTYGPYGEMHTSKMCTYENVAEALQTLLENTSDDIRVSVRTPRYVAGWLGISYKDFDVNNTVFQKAVAKKGKYAKRVGMYNDGYLGSSTDLGTFDNLATRKKGVEWLNEYGKYTPYGGECVANNEGGYSVLGKYNNIDYISKEGFETHTAYLNIAWNDKVIAAWREIPYNGEGEYKGKTAFEYIRDHLGYRFVLRDSLLSDRVSPNGTLMADFKLENVGFSNIHKDKRLTLVLKKDNEVYELSPNEVINPCEFPSNEMSTISSTYKLPNLKEGEYSAYLRISQYGNLAEDKNFHCIQFGNKSDYWDKATGSNYIGTFSVVAPEEAVGLKGDVNMDGVVDKTDSVRILRLVSGLTNEFDFKADYDYNNADVNGDGKVNLSDAISILNF